MKRVSEKLSMRETCRVSLSAGEMWYSAVDLFSIIHFIAAGFQAIIAGVYVQPALNEALYTSIYMDCSND